jgi:hypothetical protein
MEASNVQSIEQWAEKFVVDEEDVDFIVNLLLERETPLTIQEISRILVTQKLQTEAENLEAEYQDTKFYSPADSYAVGDKLVFPALNFSRGVVTQVRAGDNPEYGEFSVITADLDAGEAREFASEFQQPHKLVDEAEIGGVTLISHNFDVETIMHEAGDTILDVVEEALEANDTLVRLAKQWFPRDLMLDVDEGHLNLAEAVLDMYEGGPLSTAEILEQIGGISDSSSESLQNFSMNAALNADKRFDEVGPSGKVLWYLVSAQPEAVQKVPTVLQYQPIEFDSASLSREASAVIEEIGDELSAISLKRGVTEGAVTLIYPHRRAGTLPLTNSIRTLFPYAKRASKIIITLVDASDGEEIEGWVLSTARYIYGLAPFYAKHSVPIGAYIHVHKMSEPGKIKIDFQSHRPRTEWLPIFIPKGEQVIFENTRRGIGTEFDPLMIMGIDDLASVDALVSSPEIQRRPLVSLLKMLIPELGRLTPQATAHIKTIYSALNVIRRCPPDVILATLADNPDFVDMGGNYWQLADH